MIDDLFDLARVAIVDVVLGEASKKSPLIRFVSRMVFVLLICAVVVALYLTVKYS